MVNRDFFVMGKTSNLRETTIRYVILKVFFSSLFQCSTTEFSQHAEDEGNVNDSVIRLEHGKLLLWTNSGPDELKI
jgi:hypothetical protein